MAEISFEEVAYQDMVYQSSDESDLNSSDEEDIGLEEEIGGEKGEDFSKLEKEFATFSNEQRNEGDAKWNQIADLIEDSSSDEEKNENGSTSKPKTIHKRPQFRSNDELLYNPGSDEKDEKYVQNIRRSYLLSDEKRKDMPESDAVLNCPMCFSVLTFDCQRHESYKNQYRAIFVQNVRTITSERLLYKEPGNESRGSGLSDAYHRVVCANCDADVAVVDSDEVFHFFNVFASY